MVHLKLSNEKLRSQLFGRVHLKVEACGICHSDVLVKEGLWPGLQYPRVLGHEIAGRIELRSISTSPAFSIDRRAFSPPIQDLRVVLVQDGDDDF